MTELGRPRRCTGYRRWMLLGPQTLREQFADSSPSRRCWRGGFRACQLLKHTNIEEDKRVTTTPRLRLHHVGPAVPCRDQSTGGPPWLPGTCFWRPHHAPWAFQRYFVGRETKSFVNIENTSKISLTKQIQSRSLLYMDAIASVCVCVHICLCACVYTCMCVCVFVFYISHI